MFGILYSSDNSERKLKAGDYALNTFNNTIIQMTEITSVIFGNDEHLVKLELQGTHFILDDKIIGFIEYNN